MSEPKTYYIDSFEKLVNVATKENAGRLSVDLASWLWVVVDIFDKLRDKHPEYKDKTNWQIMEVAFQWIDDGKKGVNRMILTNKDTGEETTVEFKRK